MISEQFISYILCQNPDLLKLDKNNIEIYLYQWIEEYKNKITPLKNYITNFYSNIKKPDYNDKINNILGEINSAISKKEFDAIPGMITSFKILTQPYFAFNADKEFNKIIDKLRYGSMYYCYLNNKKIRYND